MGSATGVASPRSHGQRQPSLKRATTRAGLAAPEIAINTDERPAVPLTLVGQPAPKLTERRTLDCTGQKAARQALDAQVFNTDNVIRVHELGGELVQAVFSMVRNLGVRPDYASGSRTVESAYSLKSSKNNGGASRNRTDDILRATQALSQLSYGPNANLIVMQDVIVRHRLAFDIWQNTNPLKNGAGGESRTRTRARRTGF